MDPQDCISFPLKTGFRCVQDQFKPRLLYLVSTITTLLIMQFPYACCYSVLRPSNLISTLFLIPQPILLFTVRDQLPHSQFLMYVRPRFILYRSFFYAKMSNVEWDTSLVAVQHAVVRSTARSLRLAGLSTAYRAASSVATQQCS